MICHAIILSHPTPARCRTRASLGTWPPHPSAHHALASREWYWVVPSWRARKSLHLLRTVDHPHHISSCSRHLTPISRPSLSSWSFSFWCLFDLFAYDPTAPTALGFPRLTYLGHRQPAARAPSFEYWKWVNMECRPCRPSKPCRHLQDRKELKILRTDPPLSTWRFAVFKLVDWLLIGPIVSFHHTKIDLAPTVLFSSSNGVLDHRDFKSHKNEWIIE
jgi:hypothetical protein